MASDEKIYKTIQWILKRMHDPRTGIHGLENMFDSDLRHSLTQDEKILFQSYILEQIEKNEALGDKAKNVNEFLANLKTDVIDKLTKVRNHEFNPKSLQNEMDKFNDLKFRFSGKNVMKYHISTSCGNAAKAFTYLNSVIPAYNEKLLKEGHSSDELLEPLDLKIIHTTDPEHIIDGQAGHTVPCVQMSDGKYRALDPQLALWHLDIKDEKNWGPEHRFGFHFLDGNIIDGGSVRHLINSFHNKEFPIVRILTVAEHDKCVSHTEFRNMTTKRDKKTKFICAGLDMVLKSTNGAPIDSVFYKLCKKIQGFRNVPTKINTKTNQFFLRLHNDWYYINVGHSDAVLWKADKDISLDKLMSAHEYIEQYESMRNIISEHTY